MTKLDDILRDVEKLKDALLINEPAHFSAQDLVNSIFGAVIFGLTFALKGLLLDVASVIGKPHVFVIVAVTLFLISAEIYFIGYNRVIKRSERKFGQFWIKRIVAFFSIGILVSASMVFMFGLNLILGNDLWMIWKIVIVLGMPCSIGAAMGDLLKKY